nr:MAG TPA: Internal head protein [Caudoviricetes sp.]
MEIEIEITRGQYRIKNGKARQYAADYGYITETRGADNEPIDVYRGLFPNSKMAYIINQYHGGFFDEHKVMLDFYDKEQAINAYRLTTGNTPEIFSCTMQQLKWWLQFGNHAAPVTAQSFPFDNENENMMTQGFNTNWTDKTAAQFIYEMRKTDEYGELTEAATLDAICFDEEQDGAQIEFQAAFDALAVENKRLEKTAQLLGLALNRTSGSLKVVENGIQISAPMKKNGTTNIAVMYEMTDGQTVSVLFHNPDTTPAKIAPDDVLISWKWLLNRKDITIVVAKENGKDLPLPTVARRVMALVEKNTARFAKANANKAAETEELARLESEKAQKLARLEELNAQIEARNNSGSLKTEPLDESALEPLNVPENATAKEVRKALETYLKQLQGKTITTSDGKTVRFSKQTTKHISQDVAINKLIVSSAIAHIVDVLKTGQFIERQELYKERSDFVAFHVYQKWVNADENTDILMQVKAAELPTGEIVTGNGLLAYSVKDVSDKTKEASDKPASVVTDSAYTSGNPSTNLSVVSSMTRTSNVLRGDNHTAIYDAAQDNEPYIFIEILEVREKNSGSLKDEKKPLVNSNIPLTADKATFDEAENFVQTYFDDLNSEQAEILKNWLAENRLPDFLNEGKTNHYQALADYLGQEIINGIRNPKRFHDKNGSISLSKLRKFFLFENARKSGILNELNKNANELTGQELGNFDLSNTESVKQLRQATREHLERLRGKWIFNHHLDADIEIRQRGIDEMIRYSANPVKLQILANIENLIATAKSVGSGFEVNGKQAEKPHIAHYFRLWNTSKVNGESFPIQIVIEQDEKGLLHYDVVLTDEQKAVLDSTRTPSSKSWNVVPNQNDYALDDIDSDNESQGGNLNLFVFNLAGNELKTNEDFQEYADYLASDRESQKLINESKQKFDEQKAERERQMAQEKAELDAQNVIIKEWIASENMSVRDAGLVLKVLNKKVDFLGKIQTTAQHIEEIIKLKNGVVRNGTMEKYSRKLDEYIDVETVTLWDSDNKGYALETKSEQNFARYLEKKFKNSGSLNSENSSQDVQDIQEFTIKNPDGTFSRALILEELDKILSKLKDDGTGMAKYSYTGSVVPLSVVKRDMKKKFEEFLDVFASEPEKALRLTQKMVDKYNNAPVSPKQNEEPQEIDVSAIDTDLSKYQNADDESFKEAVGRVLDQLQGKYVNTQIGKVLFNAVSVGELKLGTKENKIRASLIPFVPETLQNGTYLGKFELAKDRSGKKGKFVAFHNFGNTVVVDNKEINHVVKVGERENGEFVFIAYHSRAVMDSANEKETVSAPDTVSNIKAGRSEAETISMNAILRKKAYGVNGVFDDIEDGKDGWNIEIISIRELNSVETIEIENSTVPELVGENGNNPQSPIGLHGANENNPTQTLPDSQDDVANRLKEKLSQIGFTEKNEDDQTSEDENVQKAREFANELIAKKYSLQQILDGEIDDKLDWLLYLDGSEYEDLAHDAMKAYAELF